MKTILALLFLAVAWLGYRHFIAPISYSPGVLLAADPEQRAASPDATPIARGAFTLTPLAHFEVDARILHRKNYHYDTIAKLAPTDLAIGWGEMSDQAVLDRLTISQSSRFYFYEYQLPGPISKEAIIRQSTNVHIIPADDEIRATCKSIRTGELAHLEGELVEANGPGVTSWRSSLRRDDTGNGACEILFVERAWKIPAAGDAVRGLLVRH